MLIRLKNNTRMSLFGIAASCPTPVPCKQLAIRPDICGNAHLHEISTHIVPQYQIVNRYFIYTTPYEIIDESKIPQK